MRVSQESLESPPAGTTRQTSALAQRELTAQAVVRHPCVLSAELRGLRRGAPAEQPVQTEQLVALGLSSELIGEVAIPERGDAQCDGNHGFPARGAASLALLAEGVEQDGSGVPGESFELEAEPLTAELELGQRKKRPGHLLGFHDHTRVPPWADESPGPALRFNEVEIAQRFGAHLPPRSGRRYAGPVDSPVLHQLARTWRQRMAGRVGSTTLVVLLAAWVVAAHLGRVGTTTARLAAAALVGVTALAWATRSILEYRGWRDAAGIVRRTLLRTDRALGQRTLRAVRLAERAQQDPAVGSARLAREHLDRLLTQASAKALEAQATRIARRWRVGGWIVFGAVLIASSLAPERVLEGLDVLVAHKHRAPVALVWLDDTEAVVHPPAYLRMEDEAVTLGSSVEVPSGSTLVFRGFPRRRTQPLVLSNGRHEVAFDDDGAGRLTAVWPATTNARLRVAARFGDVLIEEPAALDIRVIEDAVPTVVLHGVPRTVRFGERSRQEVRYVAEDDHGLTQVDLVLRSGGREERRLLAQLEGTSRWHGGATALTMEDSFLKLAFLPVLVTVEARDNDDSKGARWGKSESVVVAMPAVGTAEAQRFDALSRALTPLVRLLADRLAPIDAMGSPSRSPAAGTTSQVHDELDAALAKSYLGVGVSRGLAAFIQGQIRRLERAGGARNVRLRTLRRVVLSLDASLQALARRDAVSVSRKLAEVAEEAASGADQARSTEREEFGIARSRAAARALDEGARQLSHLGELGADLGAVCLADVARLSRAVEERNMLHAELIARHIAARLNRADASFSGGGSGAVESGPGGAAEAHGRASDTDAKFDQRVLELEQLIEEHRGNLDTVEHTVQEARSAVDELGWQAEAGRLAGNLRDRAASLPRVAGEPDSEEDDAAFAREHAEAMADSLDELELEDAMASGRDARNSLEAASRKAAGVADPSPEDTRAIQGTMDAVKEALRWATARSQEAARIATERSRGTLRDAARKEKDLAGRARRLTESGTRDQAMLPESSIRALQRAQGLMDQAGAALDQGGARQALGLLRQAQESLEQAMTGRTSDTADPGRTVSAKRHGIGGRSMRTRGSVGSPASLDEAARFRERVLRGLGRPGSGELAPAVRRYAEELLK
jgi:hypothetical protein